MREMSAIGVMQWDLSRDVSPGDPSLHACWRCGSQKVFTDYRNAAAGAYQFIVWCYDCGTETAGRYDSEPAAIKEWNDHNRKNKLSIW